MMAITDPRVITFVNEQLRPLAERTRAVQAEIETTLAYAQAEVVALIQSAAERSPLEDGREAEGVSRLTREDLLLALDLLNDIATEVRQPENAEALQAMFKACVRPLRIINGV